MTATTIATKEELGPTRAGATRADDRVDERRRDGAGWAVRLLEDDGAVGLPDLSRRAATGLALSAVYGLCLGLRQGGPSLVRHAAGVPLGMLLVVLVGAPSVFVFLSLCRAPIDLRALASTVSRGVASAGVLLAGLAPAAALFVVSSETPEAAASAVTFGLVLGGGVALFRSVWELRRFAASASSPFGASIAAAGFAVFAVALAARVWTGVLPILAGGTP